MYKDVYYIPASREKQLSPTKKMVGSHDDETRLAVTFREAENK